MLRNALSRLKSRFPSYVFTRIYTKRRWKGSSASGEGSSMEETRVIRAELPNLLAELGIKSLLDIPCGDMYWMSGLDLGAVQYIGADIVRPLVEDNRRRFARPDRRFEVANLISDALPKADAILCRDCLVHLCHKDVRMALDNIKRSGATWLLVTTHDGDRANEDILTGQWHAINLRRPPYNFPPPFKLINEQCEAAEGQFADKSLGVWKVADLP